MSSDLVVTAESVSKRYRIGRQETYSALRDVLAGVLTAPVRRLRHGPSDHPEIAALEDVSFSIARGEVLGLVGANGAGKSTLLKVLSRITEPSSGRVVIRGRVGSLLEVGTGFHPELTGRENIFLNGTILGMRKAEIVRRFDEIVEFSGVARFLDTPVKRYSSGMQVRLAFAVAAHLEPEILLVDEVLAVGDADFQRKCLGKMHDVTRDGRTVVFVSHNLAAVRSLCDRALVLEQGRLAFDGDVGEAVDLYLGRSRGESHEAVVEGHRLEQRLAKSRLYGADTLFTCDRISVLDDAGRPSTSFKSDEDITIAVDYTILKPPTSFRIIVGLVDANQVPVLRTETLDDPEADAIASEPGTYRAEVTIPAGLFGEAQFDLNVSLVSEVQQIADYVSVAQLALHFAGHGRNMRGSAYLRPLLHWTSRSTSDVVESVQAEL
jgi:lipopolysaccharide transport system ATP-binding protein